MGKLNYTEFSFLSPGFHLRYLRKPPINYSIEAEEEGRWAEVSKSCSRSQSCVIFVKAVISCV
jgi:hypothetical protein